MTDETEFRTREQEVLKLLEECSELKRMLGTISSQLSRIENRVKRTFPVVAVKMRERQFHSSSATANAATLNAEEALTEFDRVVKLAAAGAGSEAEKALEAKSVPDLLLIAKELGISFSKSKPSIRKVRESIFGKVRESVLLTRHNVRKES